MKKAKESPLGLLRRLPCPWGLGSHHLRLIYDSQSPFSAARGASTRCSWEDAPAREGPGSEHLRRRGSGQVRVPAPPPHAPHPGSCLVHTEHPPPSFHCSFHYFSHFPNSCLFSPYFVPSVELGAVWRSERTFSGG